MKQYSYLIAVLTIALMFSCSKAHSDEGTFRHVAVGFGTTLACSYFLRGLFRLEQDEKWKSSLICMGGLAATSFLMEGAQAQERNKSLDMGDVGNNMLGGAAATTLYLTLPF